VTGIITNDDVRVRILGDVSIVEGNAGDLTLDFVVSLSTASDHGATVNYPTENLTASSDDFDAPTIPLEFAPGETSKPVHITVHGDLVGELDESFLFKLTGATNATISRTTALGRIFTQ